MGIVFSDIGVIGGCKNLESSYGEVCVRCNRCGRFSEDAGEHRSGPDRSPAREKEKIISQGYKRAGRARCMADLKGLGRGSGGPDRDRYGENGASVLALCDSR